MRFSIVILFLLVFSPLFAQQSAPVKKLENERQKLMQEMELTTRLLNENKKTTTTALNRLNLLAQQIASRKEIIGLLNNEITSIDEEIFSREKQIHDLEKNLEQKKKNYVEAIQKIYIKKNSQDNLLLILSAENFTQSFRRILYLREYSNWRKTQACEIKERQAIVNEEKNNLLRTKEEKNVLLGERKKEEIKLSKEESYKKEEIKSLQSNQKKLQNELAKKKKQAADLNKKIEKIIAEEVEKARKEAQKKGTNRAAETKGGYAMTKEEKALSSNFVKNKGKLPFPLKGAYKIVSHFGVNNYKEIKNVSVNNNGIDIETTSGNEARAIFEGVVSRVFTLPGYNNSVIIRHGNYLTLYSYIDQVYVKQGEKVKTGQALGKIHTNKENGNATILHFELWREQTSQNPLPWLNK